MRKVNEFTAGLCKILLIIMVPAMTVIVFVQVLLRYVFSAPLVWVEEAAKYLLVWVSFFGSAYAVRYGMHITLIFLNNKFRGYAKLVLDLGIQLLLIVFSAICVIEGMNLSLGQWDQMSPGMRIPQALPYMAMPIAFAFIIMYSIEFVIADVKKVVLQQEGGLKEKK